MEQQPILDDKLSSSSSTVQIRPAVIREPQPPPRCEIVVSMPSESVDHDVEHSMAPNENGFNSSLGDTEVDENLPYPGFPAVSLRYLRQTSRPRSWCLVLITNPWFERVSMMVILLNCVTLGMYQPCEDQDDKCNSNRCTILQIFDHLIFAFFATEMVIKITAMGFWGKGTYLAETWNRLDCFIVIAGFAEYCLNVQNMNLSSIRTVRVLRPLRAINRIPSMRILVMLLLDTLPMLGNVLLLCFFVFFIFGIVGVQLWAGLLRQRCHTENITIPENMSQIYFERMRVLNPLSSYYQDVELEKDYICSLPKDSGMHRCENFPPTRYNGMICNGSAPTANSNNEPNNSNCINWNQYYTSCRPSDKNPFQGAISFDNIGLAWVAIFLVISLEGWTDIMYYVQDAHSFWDWIYFVLLIVIGSFFMINLCLVVIATQFSETKKREMERMRMERARYQSTSTLASNSMSEPTSCYTAIIKYIAHLWRRAKRKAFVYYKNYKSKREKDLPPRAISLRRKRRRKPLVATVVSGGGGGGEQTVSTSAGTEPRTEGSPPAPTASPEVSDIDPVASPRRPVLLQVQGVNGAEHSNSDAAAAAAACGHVDQGHGSSLAKRSPQSSTNNHLGFRPSPLHSDGRRASHFTCQELLVISGTRSAALAATLASGCNNIYSSFAKGEKHFSAPQLLFYPLVDPETLHVSHSEGDWSDSETGYDVDELHSDDPKRTSLLFSCLGKIRKGIQFVVDHRYFQRGILLAILINTLSMGIEYHNQPDELTITVETSNIVFSAIFAFEMLLKLLAEGPFKYISNGFNVFDGIIVILSMVELCQKSEGSGLSVLRTFRLLRILKLVRFMPALKRQLFVMLRTMDNVAVFFALLVLFIFIFSILGMNLFGCKFCRVNEDHSRTCERKNFDSLLWAIVTVFQILTQEDWNVVLFNGMERTSHWAALYFVALMTFGNYVLFNLLVAILVEGFSAERHEFECEEKHAAIKALEKRKEEKKASSESLTKGEDGKVDNHSLEEKEREFKKLSQFDDDDVDPKCNIMKETRMLHLPPVVAITKSDKLDSKLVEAPCVPPIITHTAATPQGSPNATLELVSKDQAHVLLSPTAIMLDVMDKSSQSSAVSIPNLLNCSPHARNSNTQLSVHFGGTQSHSPQESRRGSLSPEACNLNRKDSLSPSPSRLQRKGSHGSVGGSPLQRRGSKGSIYNWRRRSRRRGDQENLMDSDAGSEDDGGSGGGAEHEEEVLNNSSSLNNSHSVSPVQDRSHCNGGLPTLQNTPNYKRNILTQQNSIGTPLTLSPQNSIRSRPQTPKVAPTQLPTSSAAAWHVPSRQNSIRNSLSRQNSINSNAVNTSSLSPQNSGSYCMSVVPSRQNSLSGSCKEEFKLNNLESASSQPLKSAEASADVKEDIHEDNKICWFFEIPPQLKDREKFSLFLFPPENAFRQICTRFTEKKWFDYTVLVFIALNCITLAMERPNIPPDSVERDFLTCANYVFTVVFAVEMVVKVVAWGLWYGKRTYFRSGWNVMDGCLVIISLVDILMSIYSTSSPRIFGILRVFRLLRSLRPLRVINRAPGLKLVVQTLLSSLRPIGNIVLICCTFFIIFGILGVQLFKGTFYYCDGPNVKHVRNKTDCIQGGNVWINRKYNFDDLGQALMSLFVLSSKDGWVNIMYQGLDAVGVDQQPIENYSEWRLLYFISFLLLVGFFVLNMFVGVVVENFHRCREEQEKEEKARRAEKRARKLEKKRRKMRDPPYYINYSRPRLFIHNIVTSKYFDLAIAAVIGLNVVTMAMEFYKMPEELVYALEIFNYFFTAVFVLESAMKMLALGAKRYFIDKWNQLDVIIVILSVVGIILEKMESAVMPINPTIIRVMRVLRIARVLKLLKMAKGIRALLDTVMQALPQVGNLGLLFFLLFFIFAALGVELFGRLECDEQNPCQGLGEHAHFQNFGMAFLTLFRVATGDNWNGIMKDTLRDACDANAECVRNCCVSPIIAPLYFVVFVLMAQFVLVNVVVAVLMKHLEESHKQMEDEFDMEVELERELAAEEEAAAAVASGAAKAASIEQNKDRGPSRPIMMYPHKPVYKISSLPANFTFNLHSDSPDSPPKSPSLIGVDVNFDTSISLTPSVESDFHDVLQPSCGSVYDDFNNVNIRQASPEEPVNKVAVANLRTIIPLSGQSDGFSNVLRPPASSLSPAKIAICKSILPLPTGSDSCLNHESGKDCLSAPISQWSSECSFSMFPTLDFGDGVVTSLSQMTGSTLSPCGDGLLLTPEISPDGISPKTEEGTNLYPPPYTSVAHCSSTDDLAISSSDHSTSAYHLNIFDSERTIEPSGTLENLQDLLLYDNAAFEASEDVLIGNQRELTLMHDVKCDDEDQSVVPLSASPLVAVDCCQNRSPQRTKSGPLSKSPSPSSSSCSSTSSSSLSSSGSFTSSSDESSPSSSHHLLGSHTSPKRFQSSRKASTESTATTTTTTSSEPRAFEDTQELGKSSKFNKRRCDNRCSNDETTPPSSLDLTGLVSSSSLFDDDGSVCDDDDDDGGSGCQEMNIVGVENEDILIVDPSQNKILCIYEGDQHQHSSFLLNKPNRTGSGEEGSPGLGNSHSDTAVRSSPYRNGASGTADDFQEVLERCGHHVESSSSKNPTKNPASGDEGSSALC